MKPPRLKIVKNRVGAMAVADHCVVYAINFYLAAAPAYAHR